MAKAATVYDVARLAGVSIATVSDTFRRPDRVRPATREAVKAAADALHYVPSASARGLAEKRTRAFGLFSFDYFLKGAVDERSDRPADAGADGHGVRVVRGDVGDDGRRFPLYVHEVQRGVELECSRRDYALLISGSSLADSTTVVTDIAGRVDGLAVFPYTVPDEVLERVARRIPVVVLSRRPQGDSLNHVTVDNRGGMRALTEHLIAEHGLRDLQFVGETDSFDTEERLAGFRAALRAAGLRMPRRRLPVPFDRAEAAKAVDDLVARDAVPEALLCVSDELAIYVMDALAAHSIAVPERVAVTGFDGVLAGRIVSPPLTTVRQPMEEMGRAVVDILVDRLAQPSGPPEWRRLPVQLVLRESCGCTPR